MADPVSKDPSSAPRRRSQIVRKYLAQPQQTAAHWEAPSTHRSIDPSRPPSLASSQLSQASSKDPSASRPLKRKISTTTAPHVPSDRPENRNVNPSRPLLDVSSYSSHVHPPRTAVHPVYTPYAHPQLNVNPPSAASSLAPTQKKARSAALKPVSTQCHHTHDDHDHRYCPISAVPSDHSYTGAIAAAEFQRMRMEIETLKDALNKATKRQTKKLEEHKAEISSMQTLAQAKELELTSIKEKHKKAEEVISTIEMSVQCQICMDLPDKPFALSPCGHVLCLLCLQEWFKKAPPSLDDMDISPEELSDPDYILMRSKSCPTCRATIRRRPAPVFMVKAVAAVLMKHNNAAPPLAEAVDEEGDTEDPWKGIFPSSDEEDHDDEDDSDYDGGRGFSEEDEDNSDFGDQLWYGRRRYPTFGFHSVNGFTVGSDDDEGEGDDDDDDEDDDDDDDASNQSDAGEAEDRDMDDEDDEHATGSFYEGDGDEGHEDDNDDEHAIAGYDFPHWAPPANVRVDVSQYDVLTAAEYKLLQRGCTMEMLRAFDVAYEHDLGIVLRTQSRDLPHLGPGMKRVFLGWNVPRLPPGDVHGVRFVLEMLADVVEHGERWAVYVSEEPGCVADVHRLVLPMDGEEDYDTTDSEAWMDAEEY